METHSSTLAWKILWMKSLVGYHPWGCKELDTTEQLHLTLPYLTYIYIKLRGLDLDNLQGLSTMTVL